MRTRRAHFRVTDQRGRTWLMAWNPATASLHARLARSRSTFTLSSSNLLLAVQLRGTLSGKPLRPDVAQLAFA